MRTARLGALTMVLGAMVALLCAGPASAAGPIAGKVTDTSTAPLAGIEVCAIDPATFAESCAPTDAGGEYSIPGSGPGAKVHFFNPGNAAPSVAPQWYPNKAHPEEAVPVTETDIAGGIDAVMAKGATAVGNVRDMGTEAPIQGVEVCPNPTVRRAGERTACAVSDVNGELVLRNLAGGEYDFELTTSGNVNYVDHTFPEIPLAAGSSKVFGFYLRRGVEAKGTLTEAGTGLPVEGLGPPYAAPAVCAVSEETEADIKCTTPGAGGAWSIPGLPPNQFFVLSFAVDGEVSDGYVGQWWHGVDWFEEATLIGAGAGVVIGERDAVLTRGDDLVPSSEEPNDEEHGSGTGTGAGAGSSTETFTFPGGPAPWPAPPPILAPPVRRPTALKCKKGFHEVTKSGHQRCVKIKKRHPARKHHK